MQTLAIVGPSDTGKTTLVERLASRLADRGPVGTVKHVSCEPDLDTEGKDTARHREAGAVQTYGIAAETWFATGESLALSDALDRLAQSCEYGLVEGYHGSRLPKVVLGDAGDDVENVVTRARSADAVAVDALAETIERVEPYETLHSLVERVTASPQSDRAGAVATFTGRVRKRDSENDEPTEYLAFEKYDGVAEQKLAAIRTELESREGVYEVRFHHRTGVVEAEENIVFVVVLAGHRAEAFRAVEDGIDRLKDEVPLFKKEVTVSEEFWAHER